MPPYATSPSVVREAGYAQSATTVAVGYDATGTILSIGEDDLLCEDNFNDGPSGWVPLMSSQYPEGLVMLDTEITYGGSRYSLFLQTGDGNLDGVSDNWGASTVLKRLDRPQTATKVYLDFRWAVGSQYDVNGPRMVQFSVDTCDVNADRNFFELRYQNWDNVSSTRRQQYQVRHNGTWTDLPGVTYPHGLNENKRNLQRLEAVFDLTAAVYDGVRVNGIGYGSLAAAPDATLRVFTPGTTSLPTFEGGLNVIFGINNRNDSANTHAWANLAYVRAVAL